jgi:hypothetical protein
MTADNWSTLIELLVFFGIIAATVVVSLWIFRQREARLAAFMAIVGAFFMVWVNLAVGIIGEPDNPANLLFFGVLLVGFLGALLVRFQPKGMVRVMYTMVIIQLVVSGLMLLTPLAEPPPPLMALLVLSGVVCALWLGAGFLFGRAAEAVSTA